MAKLEATEAKLAQTELDLNSEQNVRRTLQNEAAESKQREDALALKQVCKDLDDTHDPKLTHPVTAAFCASTHRCRCRWLLGRKSRNVLERMEIIDFWQFQDKYLTKKASGGEALADELMVQTREYLRPQFEDVDAFDIIVRVYSNLEGMANFLVKLDKVRNLGQLRAFSTGFCGRISTFDWIDTGVGKEGGAGRKVRGKLSYSNCKTKCQS